VVQLGFVAVYLGFAYGIVCIGLLVARRSPVRAARRDHATLLAAVPGIGVVLAHWMPFLHGPVGGRVETFSGWAGLDPLSTGATTLLALAMIGAGLVPRAGGDLRRVLVVGLGVSMVALTGGNALIQTFTSRGTEPDAGIYVASALALLTALAAAANGLRDGPPGRFGGSPS
jgi:hypothetical protein